MYDNGLLKEAKNKSCESDTWLRHCTFVLMHFEFNLKGRKKKIMQELSLG